MAQTVSGRVLGRHGLAVGVLVFVVVLCAGCATTNPDSDLPWNMQQPWETAPAIPGLNR